MIGSKAITDALVLERLDLAPAGARSREIAAVIGRSEDATKRSLMRLGDYEKARYIRTGGHTVWYAPKHAATVAAAHAANVAAVARKKRESKSQYAKRVAAAKRGQRAARSYAERPLVQRTVPAAHAKPLRKSGPASVWELGS